MRLDADEPLRGVGSIRTRLALLVGVSVVVAALVGAVGREAGVPLWIALPVTIVLALSVTWWLARGMTVPLRAMTDAASRMAAGDYTVRVETAATDEVGTLARAFTAMARDLEQADTQRRRLVATVAHELRTPLSAQQALLENLVDGVTTPDGATLRSALAQSERLGALVADLLDLSRQDGRGTALTMTDVPVAELVDACVAEAGLQGRDVTLRTAVHPPGLTVRADRGRLAQVVANLLDNALRHSPEGGTVTVTTGLLPAGDGRWMLTVADEGPGIPPERADRLFTRFGTGGDDGGGGTGLGLAIAGWVAALHGGAMSALPPDPTHPGARLRLTLPTHPATPRPTDAKDAPMTSTPPSPLPSTGASVAPPRTPPSTLSTTTLPPAGSATTSATPWPGWPERVSGAQPRLLAAAIGIGVVGSALLPSEDLGLGLLVVTWLAGGLMWAISPRGVHPWSIAVGVTAAVLSLTLVLRDDPAYGVLAVLVGGVLGAASCTGGRTVSGMVLGAMAWPLSGLRGLPLLDRTLRSIGRHRSLWPVVRTAGVCAVLLLVFGGLLASADAVLGSWAAAVVPTISDDVVARVFTLVFVAGVAACGLYLAINPPHVDRLADEVEGSEVARRLRVPAAEWVWPLLVLVAVFVAFLVAQGAALLGGDDYVLRTTGLTYAEYARQGFGQLTLTTALVLAVVAAARRLARCDTPGQLRLQRALCATLLGLALVVVASALRRMALYQAAFGWTVDRLGADVVELWLGGVVLATLVSLVVPWRRWLARYALLSGAAALTAFLLVNPAAVVAQANVDRYAETGRIDLWHLRALGGDAVPTVAASDLPEEAKRCVLAGLTVEEPGLGGWNLARSRAQEVYAQYRDVDLPQDCGREDPRQPTTR